MYLCCQEEAAGDRAVEKPDTEAPVANMEAEYVSLHVAEHGTKEAVEHGAKEAVDAPEYVLMEPAEYGTKEAVEQGAKEQGTKDDPRNGVEDTAEYWTKEAAEQGTKDDLGNGVEDTAEHGTQQVGEHNAQNGAVEVIASDESAAPGHADAAEPSRSIKAIGTAHRWLVNWVNKSTGRSLAVVGCCVLVVLVACVGCAHGRGTASFTPLLNFSGDFTGNWGVQYDENWIDYDRARRDFSLGRASMFLFEVQTGSVVDPTVLAEVQAFRDRIKALEVEFEGRTFSYADLCQPQPPANACAETSILDFVDGQPSLPTPASPLFPIFATLRPTLLSATSRSMTMSFVLHPSPKAWEHDDSASRTMERAMLAVAEEWDGRGVVRVRAYTVASLGDEVLRMLMAELPMVIGVVVCMVLYLAGTLGRVVLQRGVTQYGLAACAVACPLFGSLVCFGIMGYARIPLTVMSAMALFLSIGIGVDGAFVYFFELHTLGLQCSHDEPIEATLALLGEAAARTGPTNFISVATSVIAFFISAATTPITGMASYALQNGLCLLFSYCFLQTFYMALVGLSARHNHAWLRTHTSKVKSPGECSHKLFRSFGAVLTRRGVPGIVLIVLVGTTGALAYTGSLVKSGMNDEMFLRRDSYLLPFLSALRTDYGGSGPQQVDLLVDHPTQELPALLGELSARRDVLLVRSFVTAPGGLAAWPGMEKTGGAEHPWLRTGGEAWRQDLRFAGSALRTSRHRILLLQPLTNEERAAQLEELRSLCATSQATFGLANAGFAGSMAINTHIRTETMSTLGVALLGVSISLLATLPTSVAISSIVAIAVIMVHVVGFMYILGHSFHAITYSVLCLSVGLSVDYSIHVSLGVARSTGDIMSRVRHGISEAGPPVLNGAITTAIGVGGFFFGQSYPFQTFAQVALSVIIFGMVIAFFFIPCTAIYVDKLARTFGEAKVTPLAPMV